MKKLVLNVKAIKANTNNIITVELCERIEELELLVQGMLALGAHEDIARVAEDILNRRVDQ